MGRGLWPETESWQCGKSFIFFHKDETLAGLLVFVFIFHLDKKKHEVFTLAEQIEL